MNLTTSCLLVLYMLHTKFGLDWFNVHGQRQSIATDHRGSNADLNDYTKDA